MIREPTRDQGQSIPAPSSLSLSPGIPLKHKIQKLSQRYQSELLRLLVGRNGNFRRRAERLGTSAMSQGLDTLDLAHIHGQALLAIIPADCPEATRIRAGKKAGAFFVETLAPIEKTRRSALAGVAELRLSNAALRQRTRDLTTANGRLRNEILQRTAAEHSLRSSEKNYRMLLTESRQMQRRLRHLSHQVLLAQEKERKEISRELHDEIVQTLTGINVQLATLKLESGASTKGFSRHITNTQRLVEKSVNIVHQFARDLRPTLLDDLGLIPALHAYMKGFTKRTGLHVGFTVFAGVEKMSNDKRTVLYRVAQAALVNVAEHAAADTVTISIRSLPEAVSMEIADNGKAFDVRHVLDSRRNKRLGLIGMRERVEMVGGTFDVESVRGRGTTILATVPFRQNGRASTP